MGSCSSSPRNLGAAPVTFPKGIEAYKQFFINWSKDKEFKCDKILIAYPTNEADVLAICRWAHENEWRVRPTGQRHNWSPLTLGPHTKSDPPIVILDMRKYLHNVLSSDQRVNQITVQPGMLLGDLLVHMSGINMSFPHTPAPYDITVGGITAINGHGTKIASADECKAGKINNFGTVSNRIIAMRVVVFEEGKNGAAGQYVLRNFTAKDPEFPALQCAVGRTLAVAITFQCVPDYYVRCRTTFKLSDAELFPKPAQDAQGNFIFPDDSKPIGARFPAKSFAYYVDKYGAAETIHFPHTNHPWLKVWNEVPKEGPGVEYSTLLVDSCPFSVSDNIPKAATYMMKSSLGIEEDASDYEMFRRESKKLTKTVRDSPSVPSSSSSSSGFFSCSSSCTGGSANSFFVTDNAPDSFPTDDDKDLYGGDSSTLRTAIADSLKLTLSVGKEGWGQPELAEKFGPMLKSVAEFGVQSDNVWDCWGPSHTNMLYVRTSTLRVTANGYAVWLPRRKLQLGVWLFMDLFLRLQDEFKSQKKYPANMPVELRVVGPDHKDAIAGNNCAPYLSACTTDGVPQEILDDHPVIIFLDNLSFPNSGGSAEFYARMERELIDMYVKHGMFVRPEWSKGWGYTAESGAYTSKWFMDHTRRALSKWNTAMDIFDKLDPKKLFCNTFLEHFMTPIDDKPASRAQSLVPVVSDLVTLCHSLNSFTSTTTAGANLSRIDINASFSHSLTDESACCFSVDRISVSRSASAAPETVANGRVSFDLQSSESPNKCDYLMTPSAEVEKKSV